MKFRTLLLMTPLLYVMNGCATDTRTHFDLSELSAEEQKSLAAAQIVLLGEQHDNPAHHQIQKDILETLGEQGRLKAIVYEQVDWGNQGILTQLRTSNFEGLKKKLDWDHSGWPPYKYYEPLFATGLKYKARQIAGGLPKHLIEPLYKSGFESVFSSADIEALKLRTPLDSHALGEVEEEIFEGHCRMVPPDHVTKMVPVQRARDAALVKGWRNEAPTDGVTVFIVGAGHARKDFGVPMMLLRMNPNLKIYSIAMQEEGAKAPPEGAYDKVLVTEAYDRPDPCAEMKAHMDKKEEDKAKDEEAPTEEPATAPKAEEPTPAADPKAEEPAPGTKTEEPTSPVEDDKTPSPDQPNEAP